MSKLTEMQQELTETVERVSKSVVLINTNSIRTSLEGDLMPVEGTGTGIIIGGSGYIVTNAHVVAHSNGAGVTLFDGRTFDANIIGMDRATDIALLKIKAWELPVAELGDSDAVKAGQIAIAIGNALGLPGSPTVSLGVISALNRPLPWADFVFEGLIQTDAAINPGNSGGPLCTIDGKVIGINTAIVPFAQGVGFSIPINSVRRIMEQILEHGKVLRPWLGISGMSLNSRLSKRFNLPPESGVLVIKTAIDGPAHISGIRSGDVIYEVASARISNMRDLLIALSSRPLGSAIEIKFLRNASKFKTEIILGETPAEYLAAQ